MKTKWLLAFIVVIGIAKPSHAQEWSLPVQISSDSMNVLTHDYAIDKTGTIHCVWADKINDCYSKIYYSKSTDNGISWTNPLDLIQNNNLVLLEPHIACDAENNLYVSYDYNILDESNTLVYLTKNTGNGWETPFCVSSGMPTSYANRIVIDNDNRVYVFWFRFCFRKTFYRYLDKNVWSDKICLNCLDNHSYYFSNIVVDNEKNIHCSGTFTDGNTNLTRKSYMKYNFSMHDWEPLILLTNKRGRAGQGLAVDQQNNPHVAFNIYTDTITLNDATVYKYYDGTIWTPDETVIEDPLYQTIAVDNYNRPFIANKEKTESGNQLVYYEKTNNTWEGKIIDVGYDLLFLKLFYHNGYLYIIYEKREVGGGFGCLMFSKCQIPLSIEKNHIQELVLEQNYPNPFHSETTLCFNLNTNGNATLKILNLEGKLVANLINEYKTTGEYRVKWNGKDNNGKEVPKGLYLYRLQVGSHVMTRSLSYE